VKSPISVKQFYESLKDKLKLSIVAGEAGLERQINVAEINRPGLAFAGYFKYFASKRVQVIGKVEIKYLEMLPPEQRRAQIIKLLEKKIPCCIIARNYKPPKELIEEAEKHSVPLFSSPLITMVLLNKATIFLADWFAPSVSVTGDLLEVYGVGILLRGPSGVGKSECALSLIKRGHRLIADDIVRVKLRGGDTLMGSGNPITRHHMEIRGLGIINVQTLFGAGCIREDKRIDIVISMEEWKPKKEYERLGLAEHTFTVLGMHLPHIIIPVRPGREVALLVEVACLNQRLKWLGHYSAKELNERLLTVMKTGIDNEKTRQDS
jgi:HPr kinase/phosphorylase